MKTNGMAPRGALQKLDEAFYNYLKAMDGKGLSSSQRTRLVKLYEEAVSIGICPCCANDDDNADAIDCSCPEWCPNG